MAIIVAVMVAAQDAAAVVANIIRKDKMSGKFLSDIYFACVYF